MTKRADTQGRGLEWLPGNPLAPNILVIHCSTTAPVPELEAQNPIAAWKTNLAVQVAVRKFLHGSSQQKTMQPLHKLQLKQKPITMSDCECADVSVTMQQNTRPRKHSQKNGHGCFVYLLIFFKVKVPVFVMSIYP